MSLLLRDYDTLIDALPKKKQSFILERSESDLVLGCLKLLNDEVDGVVCGAVYPTKTVLKTAFKLIGLADGYKFVSSFFIMLVKEKVLVFSDCAVNVSPSSEELCEIASHSVISTKRLEIVPRVAFLSYSTGDSGTGNEIDKIKAANQFFSQKKLAPSEGPIQFDAAVDFKVSQQKIKNSPIRGDANVFIFPDLNSGNITYKAVQRLTGGKAIGPVLQGLKKPLNDLSRGSEVEDIILTILVTALQS